MKLQDVKFSYASRIAVMNHAEKFYDKLVSVY